MYRLDYMHRATVSSKRYDSHEAAQEKGQRVPEREFLHHQSGVAWEPAIKFTQAVLGVDRVLYAMDYPYQCDADEVVALDAMDMGAADKKAFFQTNAERAFKL